jgi:hypothetical protein
MNIAAITGPRTNSFSPKVTRPPSVEIGYEAVTHRAMFDGSRLPTKSSKTKIYLVTGIAPARGFDLDMAWGPLAFHA